MDESTTRQLSDILSRIDSTRGMDQYMEIPKVAESCQSFRQYFHSLPAVQNMDSGDLIQKSGLLNHYGSQNAVWVKDRQQGGGGNSVSFDADGTPEVTEDTKFVRTDHFLYPAAGETVRPDSLAVWARSVTFELTEAGTPRTRSASLSEDLFPMKLVQFYNVK